MTTKILLTMMGVVNFVKKKSVAMESYKHEKCVMTVIQVVEMDVIQCAKLKYVAMDWWMLERHVMMGIL